MFKKIQTLPRHFKNNISNTSSPALPLNNFQNDNEKYSSLEKLSSNDNNNTHKIIGTSTVGRRTIVARKSVANYDKYNGSMMSLNSNKSESGLFTDSIKGSKEKLNRASILNMNFSNDSDSAIQKSSNLDSYNDDNIVNNNNNLINNNTNNTNDEHQPVKTSLVRVKHSRTKSLKNIITGAGIKRSQTSESINIYGSNGNINTNSENIQKDEYAENRTNIKNRYDNFFLTNEPPDEQTINNLFERIMDETGIDEIKRNYLRNQPIQIKWNMIKAKYLKEMNDKKIYYLQHY
ncbi:hypothetical protein PIROE2DRAFT_10297 [Piromyces sp. E2]|nr:hypothetical protein PIROE2DRAFT_10297 [Piromyces sp. E2]|eukprot:OUM63207.1 hypothetical protein PIROE2DRAFT_10297 [Piromyces sp. E2]